MKLNQFMKIEQIEELMNKQKNKRDYERLLTIRLLMSGATPEDVEEEINRIRATIYNWAEHWNENGWESLKYKAPTGKTPKLDVDDLTELKNILETKKPKDIDFLNTAQNFWDIEKAMEFINGYFGTNFTYYGAWRILREKLKFQYAKPYPKNYKRPDNAENILKKRLKMR